MVVDDNQDRSVRRTVLKSIGTAGLVGLAGCVGGGDGGDGSDGDGGDGGSDGGDGSGGDGSDGSDGGGGDGSDGSDGGDGSGQQETRWGFAGSDRESPGYSWAAAWSQLINQNSDQLDLQPQVTKGLNANLVRMSKGDSDIGLATTAGWWSAKLGDEKGGFEEPIDDLAQVVTPTTHIPGTLIGTTADSGIETIEDLRGKRFSFPHRGSHTIPVIRELLKEAGVFDDIGSVIYQGFGDTRSAVLEGRIDAFELFNIDMWLFPGAYSELLSQRDIVSVKAPQSLIDSLLEDDYLRSVWKVFEVSQDKWNTPLAEETTTVFTDGGAIMARPDADNDLIYHFLDLTMSNIDSITDMHPVFQTFGFGSALEDNPYDERFGFRTLDPGMEFHEGAKQWYADNDISLPGE